jgi:hypothetical protein
VEVFRAHLLIFLDSIIILADTRASKKSSLSVTTSKVALKKIPNPSDVPDYCDDVRVFRER